MKINLQTCVQSQLLYLYVVVKLKLINNLKSAHYWCTQVLVEMVERPI